MFLPTHLTWFVEWEEKDFTQRQKIFEQTGRRMSRKFPDENDYEAHMRAIKVLTDPNDGRCRGGLYNSYILEPIFSPAGMKALKNEGLIIPGPLPRGPKQWHGAPMAALNRGFVVTGAPWMKLPKPEWELLCTLQRLYSRELPHAIAAKAETAGQISIASYVQSYDPQPTGPEAQAQQENSDLATSAFVHPTASGGQPHNPRQQNAPSSDDNIDSAVDLYSQRHERKRKATTDNTHDNDRADCNDYDLRLLNGKRCKLRGREREEVGVHDDTWCFGPLSSSKDKIEMHVGRTRPDVQGDLFPHVV